MLYRAIKLFAFSILICFFVISCGLSKEEIGKTVKESMQEKFNSDADFKQHGLSVTNVQVLQETDNKYKGIAQVMFSGKSYDVPVQITADGENVMWSTEQGAFLFIGQKELENLSNSLGN